MHMVNTITIAAFVGTAVLSYLLGSLNFAIIISRIFGDDVRRHGSGSAGMTNILRTYGKGPAACTLAGDFLKTILAIFLARFLFAWVGITALDAGYYAGLFVLLGHLYPLYFGFKGGKGVVTSMAIMLCVNPLAFLIVAVIFIPFVFAVKIVSLASILGAIAFPLVTCIVRLIQGRDALLDTLCASVIGLIVIIKHRDNIKRLLNGTENKFGKPKGG